MKIISIVVLIAGLIISPFVKAACHLKSGSGIVCYSAQNAATAFHNYGLDASLANQSHHAQILRQASCKNLSDAFFKDAEITEVASRNVATPKGWVEVVAFFAENKISEVYVARPYLQGTCTKWQH